MSENITEMHLFQKLSAISREIGTVSKEIAIQGYKAVSERSILESVKPLEDKYHVYSYPMNREVVYQEQFGENKEYIFVRIKTTYRFVNIDMPCQYVDIDSFGDGVDKMDKGCGKAMTYADKYALMKAYKIVTGDDPDYEASVNMNKKEELTEEQKLQKALVDAWNKAKPEKVEKVQKWLEINKKLHYDYPEEVPSQYCALLIKLLNN